MKIKINKVQHQLISRFISKERSRFALNNIGVIDGHIYATDGRRCVKIKMNAPIPDGTYKFFFDGDYYLFKQESLFPNADKIMPDFNNLVKVCEVNPRKNDGILMMNCVLDIFENTSRRINLSFLIDLDVGHKYDVFTIKDQDKTSDGYLYFRCNYDDNFYGKPEIVLLPFHHY